MSGTITRTFPISGFVADGYKAYWGGLTPTAIALDICSPGYLGKSWFTGYSTGGYLNFAGCTMTGTVSGGPFSLSALGVTNFGLDRWGNFNFQMPTPNTEEWIITQGGVSSPAWNANGFASGTWSPVNLASPSGVQCMFWFDPQDPTCVLLADGAGNNPVLAGICNKLNNKQFLTANGLSLPTWGRGGGGPHTRQLLMTQNPNNTTPYQALASWFGAFRQVGGFNGGNGNGMDNIIALLDSNPGAFPNGITIVFAVNKVANGTAYGNGWIYQGQMPGPPSKYTQCRWNSVSGTPLDLNLAWGAGAGIGNATAMADGEYYLTATISAGGALVFRVNGSQTGTGSNSADATNIVNQVFGLGINNLPTGNQPPSNYPNGVPFTAFGSVQIYAGVLAAGDITSAETWVARSTL